MRWFLFIALFGLTQASSAAFIEVGASVNYRSSGYDSNNKVESLTYTSTLSYYFWEMCAWEFSYTTGYSKQVTKGSLDTDKKETIEDNIDLASADIVLSFAGRQDPFRPYIKLGGGYLVKERFRQIDDGDKLRPTPRQEGIVPSGGFGLALSLTKELSIKIGMEAWTSPPRYRPVIVDYAGRAGISWIF